MDTTTANPQVPEPTGFDEPKITHARNGIIIEIPGVTTIQTRMPIAGSEEDKVYVTLIAPNFIVITKGFIPPEPTEFYQL